MWDTREWKGWLYNNRPQLSILTVKAEHFILDVDPHEVDLYYIMLNAEPLYCCCSPFAAAPRMYKGFVQRFAKSPSIQLCVHV